MFDENQLVWSAHHTPRNSGVQVTLAPSHQYATIDAMNIAELGANIRRFRKERNLTVRQLAELANYDSGNLSKLENGKQGITLDSLLTIAKVLSVSAAELFIKPQESIRIVGPEENRLLDLFNQATPEGKTAIIQVATALPKSS